MLNNYVLVIGVIILAVHFGGKPMIIGTWTLRERTYLEQARIRDRRDRPHLLRLRQLDLILLAFPRV